jgi:ABC-type amino acid transport system permease subunit
MPFIVSLLTGMLGPQYLFKLGAIAAGLVALVIAYGIWHHHVYMEGWNAAINAVARQDAKAIAAAKAGRDAFNKCRDSGLRWDQSTGQCGGR